MFKSVNPATGETFATYAELTKEELNAKLDIAVTAYKAWRKSSMGERTQMLGAIADTYEKNKDKLAKMATAEMGKTYASSVAEVEKCIACFRHYAKEGPAMLEPRHQKLSNGGTAEVHWLSQGPVLAIMPWNFPFWQAVRFLAPTILAGNTGLLKHASIVQGVGALMEEMVLEAGGPVGLFQNLAIKSSSVAALIADDRVVAVTLTGSEGAGIQVGEQAGHALKKVVLELGGSDPFIVMPSANIEEAVKQAVKARIQNTGQSCICGKRMIVHADMYESVPGKILRRHESGQGRGPDGRRHRYGPAIQHRTAGNGHRTDRRSQAPRRHAAVRRRKTGQPGRLPHRRHPHRHPARAAC